MKEFTFEITFQRQLASLSWMIIIWGILLSIYMFFFGFVLQPTFGYIFLFFFLVDVVPTILVHVQYLKENWRAALDINKELKTLSYKSPKISLEYHFGDIVSLLQVSSYGGG